MRAGSVVPVKCTHYKDEQDEVQVQSHCAQTDMGVLRRGHPYLSHLARKAK